MNKAKIKGGTSSAQEVWFSFLNDQVSQKHERQAQDAAADWYSGCDLEPEEWVAQKNNNPALRGQQLYSAYVRMYGPKLLKALGSQLRQMHADSVSGSQCNKFRGSVFYLNYQIKAQEAKEKEAEKCLKDLEKKANRRKLIEIFRSQSMNPDANRFSDLNGVKTSSANDLDKETIV